MLLIILAACGNLNSSKNEGQNVISKDKDEISLKIENTKNIGIYDIVSSRSNSIVHITDPEIINHLESLFNNTTFIKCATQEHIRAQSFFISFYNDSSSISLFLHTNDIVDIDGTKYKSEDITFDEINKLYLEKKKSCTQNITFFNKVHATFRENSRFFFAIFRKSTSILPFYFLACLDYIPNIQILFKTKR